jgi:hypothetical protein
MGDRLVQVNGKADPKSILAELKAQKELKLVVARAERRIDQNRSLLTLKESCGGVDNFTGRGSTPFDIMNINDHYVILEYLII